MTTDFNIFGCRWIHPQCLLNFENIFYPLLHGCQKTFLPKIFESEAVCRHSLICCMSSCKLTDIFWSMTHHVPSIYMNTPLSVCGLKGMISVSTIILDDFTFLFAFFFTLCFIYSEGPIPLFTAE